MVPKTIKRIYYGNGSDDVMEMPNLIKHTRSRF